MRQPRQPYWKPQHEVFIRCMLQHEDLAKSYRAAYPKASATSARTAAIRLYNKPLIRQRLGPVLAQRNKEALQQAARIASERRARQRATLEQMQEFLRRIVKNEVKKPRVLRIGGREVTLPEDLSLTTRIRAGMLLVKLFEDGHNRETLAAQYDRLVQQLEVNITNKHISGISKSAKSLVLTIRQHPVTNSQPNTTPATVSTNQNNPENTLKPGNKYYNGNILRHEKTQQNLHLALLAKIDGPLQGTG